MSGNSNAQANNVLLTLEQGGNSSGTVNELCERISNMESEK